MGLGIFTHARTTVGNKTWLSNMQAKQALHTLMKDIHENPENYRNVKIFAFEPSLSTQPKLQHFEIYIYKKTTFASQRINTGKYLSVIVT